MEGKIENRGGARPGAGRKPGKEQKRTVSFRLKNETIEKISLLRAMGIDVTAMIEDMVARVAQ